MNRPIVLIFVVILLSACSATGPKYSALPKQPLNGKSEIVVYRLSQLAASGGCYRVNVDGESIGILANGGYVRRIVEPGSHKISIVLREGLDLDIDTKPDETNYIQYDIGVNSMSAFPIGTISVVNIAWDVSLVDTPKDYGLNTVNNLRQSLKTHTCMSE